MVCPLRLKSREPSSALPVRAALGFSRLVLHNVNREQERFVDDFGAHVLPQLADARVGDGA